MTLAIFDLDNTLIADDSDYLWGKFLVDQGIVDRLVYDKINAQFYEDYQNGTLDMMAFLRFDFLPSCPLYQGGNMYFLYVLTSCPFYLGICTFCTF